MDRRVKERLIGATLLVIVIVLVVPELLSGPQPARAPMPANAAEAVRTYTVDLAQNTATSQPAVPAPGITPGHSPAVAPGRPVEAATTTLTAGTTPAAGTAAVAGTAPAAATTPAAGTARTVTATAPVPLESAASSPISGQHKSASLAANPAAARNQRSDERDGAAPGAWSVQLGSFANRANAQALARAVKGKGFTVYVSSSGAGTSMRYRVRTGPWANRDAALQTVATLKAQGQSASLVPPAP